MNRPAPRRVVLALAAALWAVGSGAGLGALWAYATAAGEPADPPGRWPVETVLARESGRPTLLVIVHPMCGCSRATLGELARLLAQTPRPPLVHALFPAPAGTGAEWTDTDLWSAAAAIPGVRVSRDDGERETTRFHAWTSGQTILYGANGELLFSGGITVARGHSGDNAGRSALLRLLRGDLTAPRDTPVFGCHLTDPIPS